MKESRKEALDSLKALSYLLGHMVSGQLLIGGITDEKIEAAMLAAESYADRARVYLSENKPKCNRPPDPPTCAHGKTMHQGCEACGRAAPLVCPASPMPTLADGHPLLVF